ncbi:hypothetical protein BC831DRAFT_462675 [Entophlyctis helioformis]|nr:hypothetical protein BC831DRAFT_462675 [Entophlyctis helioformis]
MADTKSSSFLAALFTALNKELESLWEYHAKNICDGAPVPAIAKRRGHQTHGHDHTKPQATAASAITAMLQSIVHQSSTPTAKPHHANNHGVSSIPHTSTTADTHSNGAVQPANGSHGQPIAHQQRELIHRLRQRTAQSFHPPDQDPLFSLTDTDLEALVHASHSSPLPLDSIVPTDDQIRSVMASVDTETRADMDETRRFKVRCRAILKTYLDRMLKLVKAGDVRIASPGRLVRVGRDAVGGGDGYHDHDDDDDDDDDVEWDGRWINGILRIRQTETELRNAIETEAIKFRRACTQIAYLEDLLEHVMRETEDQRTVYLREVLMLRDQLSKASGLPLKRQTQTPSVAGLSPSGNHNIPGLLQSQLRKISAPEREALHRLVQLERDKNTKLRQVISRLKGQLGLERLKEDANMDTADDQDAGLQAKEAAEAAAASHKSQIDAWRQLQTLKAEVSHRDTEHTQKVSDLEAEIDHWKAQCMQLDHELKDAHNKSRSMVDADILLQQSRLAEAKRQVDGLQTMVAEKTATITQLRKEIDDLRAAKGGGSSSGAAASAAPPMDRVGRKQVPLPTSAPAEQPPAQESPAMLRSVKPKPPAAVAPSRAAKLAQQPAVPPPSLPTAPAASASTRLEPPATRAPVTQQQQPPATSEQVAVAWPSTPDTPEPAPVHRPVPLVADHDTPDTRSQPAKLVVFNLIQKLRLIATIPTVQGEAYDEPDPYPRRMHRSASMPSVQSKHIRHVSFARPRSLSVDASTPTDPNFGAWIRQYHSHRSQITELGTLAKGLVAHHARMVHRAFKDGAKKFALAVPSMVVPQPPASGDVDKLNVVDRLLVRHHESAVKRGRMVREMETRRREQLCQTSVVLADQLSASGRGSRAAATGRPMGSGVRGRMFLAPSRAFGSRTTSHTPH